MSFTKPGMIIVFLALLLAGGLSAQGVVIPFIYSNEGNSESWLNADDRAKIAEAIKTRLRELGVKMGENDDQIVALEGDGELLRKYMEENPRGVVIMDSIEAPKAIFAKDDDTFVEKWLENGGIMTWLSGYPFQMRDHGRVTKAVSRSVFDIDRDIQKPLIPKEQTKPTVLGERFMPSLKPFETFIPVNIAALDELGFRYEIYGTAGANDEYADPIMFQSPDMKGWFMYTHMNQYTDFVDWNVSTMKERTAEQIGTEIAEFVINRFLFYSVESVGKLAGSWGWIKNCQGK
ncbi:hypothetical protein ACFL6S_16870 [Candidatus Poribacteria bacterium]